MTRPTKHLTPFLFFVSTLAGFWFLSSGIDPETNSSLSKSNHKASAEIALKPTIRAPGSIPQTTGNPVTVNTNPGQTLPAWKSALEKNLLTQGAGQLKSAVIEKVDSFNWKMGNVDVPVDSVLVKLEHVKGHRSSFRAIVDSSNGKILQTWDHPVIDNFGDKHAAGIKIDPRYHND